MRKLIFQAFKTVGEVEDGKKISFNKLKRKELSDTEEEWKQNQD